MARARSTCARFLVSPRRKHQACRLFKDESRERIPIRQAPILTVPAFLSIFFDEIDAIASRRESDDGMARRLLTELLIQMSNVGVEHQVGSSSVPQHPAV
jgi:hypothetical protein